MKEMEAVMTTPTITETRFLWLEITGRCQLDCGHCYASSGPKGDHGTMTLDDWRAVIDQAAEAGVASVQFIGGEPTLHPALPGLIAHALGRGLGVEVYTNLVHVTASLWDVFARPGVSLATSFYTDDRDQHREIAGHDTLRQTGKNIAVVVAQGIELRVGIVRVLDDQRIAEAKALLAGLGVTNVRVDDMRRVGRAPGADTDVTELCGRCGDGCAAVLPDGQVAPCPLGRWLTAGSVLDEPLGALTARAAELAAEIPRPSAECGPSDGCNPPCEPQCTPGCDPGVCKPHGGR
jgi:organic radical activating enzyme